MKAPQKCGGHGAPGIGAPFRSLSCRAAPPVQSWGRGALLSLRLGVRSGGLYALRMRLPGLLAAALGCAIVGVLLENVAHSGDLINVGHALVVIAIILALAWFVMWLVATVRGGNGPVA